MHSLMLSMEVEKAETAARDQELRKLTETQMDNHERQMAEMVNTNYSEVI